jgi:hypothetical protein
LKALPAAKVLAGDQIVDPATGIRFVVRSAVTVDGFTRLEYETTGPRLGCVVPADRGMRGRRPQRKGK